MGPGLPAFPGRPTAALLLVALVGGCAVQDRAEALYYRQHRVAAALAESIVAAEPEDPVLTDRLYDAEDALNGACAALREAGYRRFNGEDIGDDLRWQIVDSLDACAAQADRTAALLRRVDPAVAGFYLDTPRVTTADSGAARRPEQRAGKGE